MAVLGKGCKTFGEDKTYTKEVDTIGEYQFYASNYADVWPLAKTNFKDLPKY